MALSLTTIANYLFKRANSKSSTNDGRQFFEEPFDGRAPVIPVQIWAQADQIPATAPALADGVTLGVVKRYVQLSLTAVPGTTNAFQSDSLRNCIPFNYAPDGTYNYQLFDSTGASIPFGAGDWIVDPAVGTVTFYGAVPGNMPPKISFFQYVGSVGMVALNPESLTFKQIATPPTTPASGYQTIFVGTDGKMKTIDSTGAIKALGSGGGGASGKNYLADYYDGSSVTGITTYNQVSTYTFTSGSNIVDLLGDAVNYPGNMFYTGQAITYSTTGTVIGGLTSGTVYYAVRINSTVFGLATSIDNAQAKRLIDLTSQGVGTQTFQSMSYGLSGGVGAPATGITQTVNTTSPLRLPSNLRLSKDAQNRIGMNWAIPFTLDRADVEPGRPMKLAFKFRTSANFTSIPGFNDVFFQLYDADNNLVVPLDSAYSQSLPVALTTSGAQWTFQPNLNGYNMRLIVDIGNINANAFDLDFIDMEISSAAGQVPGVFASPVRQVGTINVTTLGGGMVKGAASADKMFAGRLADYGHLVMQYSQAAGTAGSGDAIYTLPAPGGQQWQFDPARTLFNTEASGGTFNSRNAWVAGALNDGTNEATVFIVPYDATRFRFGLIFSGPNQGRGYHGALFAYSSAFSFSVDVNLPILGFDAGPTYSTSEIALKNTPTMQVSTPTAGATNSVWHTLTGNSLTLSPGMYDLGGLMDFSSTGASPGYTNLAHGWFAANGNNTSTTPAALNTIPGITIFGGPSPTFTPFFNENQPTVSYKSMPAMALTVKLTQSATLYYDANATGTAMGNAKITTTLIANKRPDYSTFGVYGQVDIRAATSTNTTTSNGTWGTYTGNSLPLPVGTWRVKSSAYFSNNGTAPQYFDLWWGLFAANGNGTATTPAALSTLPNVVVLSAQNVASRLVATTTQLTTHPHEMIIRVTSGTATVFSDTMATSSPTSSGPNAVITSYINAERLQ